MSEHLEKIPYLLSLFFPVGLFFTFGIALSYLLWHHHAKLFQEALRNNQQLNERLLLLRKDSLMLSEQLKKSLQRTKKIHEHQLLERDQQIDQAHSLIASLKSSEQSLRKKITEHPAE